MANRKRNIQMKFYVTEDEKRLIDEKMSQFPTRRYGAYLRKMAIDGYIIYTDTADIKAFTKELSAIGRNINQIAKRINAGACPVARYTWSPHQGTYGTCPRPLGCADTTTAPAPWFPADSPECGNCPSP